MRDEFLVVWQGADGAPLAESELEIYGQRVGPIGAQIGADDFRISDAGSDGSAATPASTPAVAYGPAVDHYVVTWSAEDPVPDAAEIFAQELTGDGVEIGTNDLRASWMGPDHDTTFSGYARAVAASPQRGEAFALWTGNDGTPPLAQCEIEVFGRRLGVSGSFVDGSFGTRPPVDATAPALTLKAARRQLIGCRRLTAQAGCDEACTVTVSAKVRMPADGGRCACARSHARSRPARPRGSACDPPAARSPGSSAPSARGGA